VLNGILFVLTTGIAWQRLPRELGFGSGMTCWRRLRDWQRPASGSSYTNCCSLGSAGPAGSTSRVRSVTPPRYARFWGSKTGPSPDRRKAGSKHHLITDTNGVPLACLLTAANRRDVTQLLPLVEAIPPLRKRGRPRRRPDTLLADRGYDSEPHRQALRARGIRPLVAKRNTKHGSHLGSRKLGRRAHPLLAPPVPAHTTPRRHRRRAG